VDRRPHGPAGADCILVTHEHGDHFSPELIQALRGPDTHVVVPESMRETGKDRGLSTAGIRPGETARIGSLVVKAFPAYNLKKPMHARHKDHVCDQRQLLFLLATIRIPVSEGVLRYHLPRENLATVILEALFLTLHLLLTNLVLSKSNAPSVTVTNPCGSAQTAHGSIHPWAVIFLFTGQVPFLQVAHMQTLSATHHMHLPQDTATRPNRQYTCLTICFHRLHYNTCSGILSIEEGVRYGHPGYR